jgi:hypothetical protein
MPESRSLLQQLRRLNPLRIVRAVDALPRLQEVGERFREDQKEVARQLRAMSARLEQLERTVKSQHEMLARLPALERRVQQSIAVYEMDATHAKKLPRIRAMLDTDRVRQHATAAVARAELQVHPGAHIVIDDLLPGDVANELVKAVPPTMFFKDRNLQRQEMGVPFFVAPEYSRLVWGFFYDVLEHAILPAIIEKFQPSLDEFVRSRWPELGSFVDSGIRLGVWNSRILLRRPGYHIRPHRDPRWAFLTALFYLQRRDDPYAYGTQFYRLREERDPTHASPLWMGDGECELVKEIPARHNTAVMFLNSTGAHGASIPADAPPDLERYLYQVQFGPDESTQQMLIAALEGDARLAWVTARSNY